MADVRQTMAALGLGLVFVPLTSCSLKVKVREDWGALHREPIALGEAARTWSDLKQGKTPTDAGIEAYNRAVLGSVSQAAPKWAAGGQGGIRIRTGGGELPLTVDSTRIPGIALSEQVLPADHVQVRRGLRHQSVVEGIGIPLVVKKPRSDSDPMIPESGLWVPATALLDLDRPGKPVLEVLDPTSVSRLEFGAAGFPLAANYTAAFARDFRDRQFQFQSALALLRFEDYADRIGLYRVTPFHPDKEPCIFIHGINSSPSTWDEVMNRIYGDESIRERHEFWTFGYPTGAPIPYMAAELRESIRGMLAFRAANGARDQRITLVGHSMGGLLSKAMTFSSGDVFCAVPHRGSDIVETPAARLLGGLIQVPTQLLLLSTRILTLSPDALTPEGFEFTRDRLTSLDQLSKKAWTTAEFLNKPLNPGVSYHSLIGNLRGPTVPLGKTGDGVVPYTSSHLEGVASEEVVRPAGHSVHRTEKGTAEIRRILLLP
jgi:pimeloyl-ACP methyl ester carboxylesterase